MRISEIIGEQIDPRVWTELRAKGLVQPMHYDSPEVRAEYKKQGLPYKPDISIITKDNLDDMRAKEPERLKQLKPIQVSDQQWVDHMTKWWREESPKPEARYKTQQIKNAYKLLYKKDMAEFIIMPQSIKPMGLIHKPGTGPNDRFGFRNVGNNRANENFADGKKKGKSRPGRVKKSGASCNGSVTSLRARAKKASGEKAKMYHWCANMKSGRKKK